MIKLLLITASAFAIAAIAQAGDVTGRSGMPAQGPGHTSMTTASGVGVVTAVDSKAGTVTIHHAPIAKLSWPAMTMTFKASPPTLLQGVKVGQSVTFTLMQTAGATTLSAIRAK